jgi:hypothetical protein
MSKCLLLVSSEIRGSIIDVDVGVDTGTELVDQRLQFRLFSNLVRLRMTSSVSSAAQKTTGGVVASYQVSNLLFTLVQVLVLRFHQKPLLRYLDFQHGHVTFEFAVSFPQIIQVVANSAALFPFVLQRVLADCCCIIESCHLIAHWNQQGMQKPHKRSNRTFRSS